tara:strand:- start:122 stop:949 length:828 start_codon:yes stop_codon:yes gene_type:complete
MVSTAWIIENIKKTNSWANHRAYAEKSLSDFLEFAVPIRIENPTLTQNWTVLNQRQRVDVNDRSKMVAGRGSPYFDKIEKMIQTESHIIGIFGSKYNSGSRLFASKQTFNNLINTNITNNPNFSIYNNKIKAEKQKIIDIENARLTEIENARIQQEEFVKNARLAKIETTRILKENNDLLREQLFAKQLQSQISDQQITFNEQTNSGDFNETPITDVNLSGGCSECSELEHKMPDGSMMKDSDMEKEPLNNNMKMAGIAITGIIGLLLYSRTVKK